MSIDRENVEPHELISLLLKFNVPFFEFTTSVPSTQCLQPPVGADNADARILWPIRQIVVPGLFAPCLKKASACVSHMFWRALG